MYLGQAFLLTLVLLAVSVNGVQIIGDATDLPHISFDFIVVGGIPSHLSRYTNTQDCCGMQVEQRAM